MKQNARNYTLLQRLGALCLAALMAVTMLPTGAVAAESTDGVFGTVTKVADPDTIRRHDEVYGDNTENAGKVTVGKSVSEDPVTISYGNTSKTFTPTGDNFIVTASQTAQVMGLVSEETLPLDVVFVLDTSGSMSASENGQTRTHYMVDAVNDVIADLMEMNTQNRVGVVAFSGHNCGTTAGSETRADNNPAIVLSNLAHYSGNAATDHLKWTTARVGWTNQTCPAIQGQNGVRGAYYGATNIQYGIAEGAKMLLNASNTVERQPFLVVLSDGAPTISFGGDNWKNPSGMWQQGDYSMITYKDPNNKNQGYTPTEGNSFLAMLTAAHYKNEITKKYGEDCTIYTVGLALSAQSNNADANIREAELEMAEMTLNPKEELSNSANMYSALMNEKWAKYAAGENFSIFTGRPVGGGITASQHDGYFDFYAADTQVNRNSLNYVVNNETLYSPAQWYTNARGYTTATRNGQTYVTIPANIDTSIKSLAYNDAYFEASQASQLTSTFQQLLTQIQKQAISSPTKVDPNRGEGFSGYLTYTDPIGEYMEVKKVYGLLADGNYYQGKQFAQYISDWDDAPDDFKQYMITVLRERSNTTSATMTDAQIEAFLKAAAASDYQANYVSDTEFDNSIVWYGNAYTAPGDEDTHVQWMKFADNDSVEYIEQQKAAGKIPDGADYVCRSYFYNGTAGGATKPNNEYMHFVVRVQRSLTAPYQQTVVISTPASLLSVEEVLITEKTGNNNTKSYTAAVTPAEPSRVIYEVGLRSDINAFNIDEIVGKDTAVVYTDAQDPTKNQTYAQETDHSGALANYDAATGTYTFYTNDWNRKRDGSEHHRAQTHATFDAAADNSFYTYTADTLIYVADGSSYKPYSGSKPSGSGYYYARTVYDWSKDTTPTNGVYDATVQTMYIPITIPSGAPVTEKDGGWYVPAGTYKASSLTGGEDVVKDDNKTETALIISHPHRTEDATNSHYTVLLGNNGKLTLQAEKTKTVKVHDAEGELKIEDGDGKAVMVGDKLTYTIRVLNDKTTVAAATVTDAIPAGTKFISADKGGTNVSGVVTWNNVQVPAATSTIVDGVTKTVMGETTVSFVVEVTEDVVDQTKKINSIDNTATVTLNNSYSYKTNTTTNPPEGKRVTDGANNPITDPVAVFDELTYHIRWYNDAVDEDGNPAPAKVTVTDKIPAGTTYHPEDSRPAHTKLEGDLITWEFDAVAGASGVITFQVNVNAGAKRDDAGVHYVENTASIQINNDPNVRVTNKPVVRLKTGDLKLSKIVTNAADFTGKVDWSQKNFTFHLREVGDDLKGKYNITRKVGNAPETTDDLTFTLGEADLTIKHNEVVTIHDIPAGAAILVTENETGYTAEYTVTTPTAAGTTTSTSKTEGRAPILEGETAASVTVSNTYDPEDLAFRFVGEKNLVASVPLGEVTFGFRGVRVNSDGTAYTGTDNSASPSISGEATIPAGGTKGTIVFAPITVQKAGDYHYLITEINGGLNGVTYDTNTQYILHFVVRDNGSGKLSVDMDKDVTVTGRTDPSGAFVSVGASNGKYTEDTISFTNTYAPKQKQLLLSGSKTMTGRPMEDNEFSFTVKDEQGNTVSTGYNTNVSADGMSSEIVFSPITYTAADMGGADSKTFVYTITEDDSGAYGVTYSKANYRITVTVTDDNSGQLDAEITKWEKLNGTAYETITNDKDKALKFANSFDTEDILLTLYGSKTLMDGSVTPHADISGQLKDQQFAFEIEQPKLDAQGNVVTENGETVWEHVAYGNNTDTDGDGKFDEIEFGAIPYELKDVGKTFTYRIHELIPDGPSKDPNMTYASNYAEVAVKVILNAGKLELKIVEGGTEKAVTDGKYTLPAATFVNVKYPSTVSVTPEAFKHTYTDRNNETGENDVPNVNFSFEILEVITGGDGTVTYKEVSEGVGSANPASGSTDPNVVFNAITYGNNDLGLHTYVIRESHRETAPVHGITHDLTEHKMTVNVTRTAEGKLEAEIQYLDASGNTVSAPTFKNEYNAVGHLNVTGIKTLNGKSDMDGKTFGFHMQRVAGPNDHTLVTGDTGIIEGISDASGNITFGTLYYDENATSSGQPPVRYYKITEVNPRNAEPRSAGYPGVTYDDTWYVIGVELHDNDAGKIDAKIVEIYKDGQLLTETGVDGSTVVNKTECSNIAFNNTYTTQTGTYVEFVATKTMTGRSPRAGEFQFGLYYIDGNEERLVDTAYNTDPNGDGNAEHIYFRRDYPASAPTGVTFNYVIKEIEGNLDTVTYATNEGRVSVKLGEDTDTATLKVVEKSNPEITFTNVFTPKGKSLPLTGKKTLQNRTQVAGEFGFDVQKQVGSDWVSVATGYNKEDGTIEFGMIHFTPADMLKTDGTYEASKSFTFRVVEVPGHAFGVNYSKDIYELKVNVTINAEGHMDAAIAEIKRQTPKSGGGYTEEAVTGTSLDFTNVYTPLNASAKLEAEKLLTGLDMEAGEFSFLVRSGINNPNGAIMATGGNAKAAAGVKAKVTFSDIGYSLTDALRNNGEETYQYTIYEEQTGQGGVTFDVPKYAEVKVVYDAVTGVLSVDSVKYYKSVENGVLAEAYGPNAVPIFANKYIPTPVTVEIPVDKTLTNKSLDAEEFTFTLKGEDKTQTVKNDANGSAVFDPLTFNKAGTYTYVVSEAVSDSSKADRYTMDNDVQVKITVTDDGKGKLHATVEHFELDAEGNPGTTELSGVEFINHYTAPSITKDLDLNIKATKDVNSPVKELPEDVKAGYKFLVMDITNKEIASGVSDKTGAIDFSPFTFENAGEYHYWIFEPDFDPANIRPGVQLDATAWELHILVGYNENNADLKDFEGKPVNAGELFISDLHVHKLSRDIVEATPVFNNTYDPTGTTLHLTAKKVLNGRELKDREFAFYLMDGGLIAAEGFNDAQGNIRFTVNYDASDIGIHNYKVVEKQGSVPGVIYDTKEYASVSVEVKDDQTKGQLVASVSGTVLADGDTIGTGVTLTNDYIAEGNVAVVKANKVLSGKPMKAEEFAFQLVNTADEKDVHKATNTADGTVTFQLAVKKAGETTYKLSEVKGTNANMTYDAKTYEVTVTATDDGLGNLIIKVAYDTDDGYAPTFYNTYTPNAVPVKLVGEKVLKGRDMTAGEFKFEVRDSSGALVALGTNDAKGVLTFNEIKFSTVGTYTLTVSETAGTAANVTYDTTMFQVTVEVTNADGELVAEVIYPTSGVKFVNTYEELEKPTEKPSNPSIPDTGDHSNVSLFMILAVVSLGACIALVVLLKKKKQD